MKKIIQIIIFLFAVTQIYAVKPEIDSLQQELKSAKHDSAKIKLLNEISRIYKSSNYDSTLAYAFRAIKLSKKLEDSDNNKIVIIGMSNKAKSHTNIGHVYKRQGKHKLAEEYYNTALEIREKINDKKGMADSYSNIAILNTKQSNYGLALEYHNKAVKLYQEENNTTGLAREYTNIGIIDYYKGNYPSALNYYHKALEIHEKQKNNIYIAGCYTNIGLIHYEQEKYDWAIDYYKKSLEIYKLQDNKSKMAKAYNNIGQVYFARNDYVYALEYNHIALQIRTKIGDKSGIAVSYKNLGQVSSVEQKYRKAMKYYLRSLKISNSIGNDEGSADIFYEIAMTYNKQKKYIKAIENAKKSLEIAKKIGALPRLQNAFKALFNAYEGINNNKKALEYYKLYTAVKDSIFNSEKNKILQETEILHKTVKREQEIEKQKLIIEKQNAIDKRRSLQNRLLVVTLIIMIILGFVLFRSWNMKKNTNKLLNKKNIEITKRNEEIEVQHKIVLSQKQKITDSILYAKTIQRAVQAPKEYIDGILGNYFIFYKPRDIVSGDFFWIQKIKNNVIVATVDCTGHGVPGAFMSMLGVSFLNEIATKNITTAAEILNQLRNRIKNALHQKNKRRRTGNGMDMSLYLINTETLELQYAGAYNSLYLIMDHNNIEKRDKRISKLQKNPRVKIHKYSKLPLKIQTSDIQNSELDYSKIQSSKLVEIKADRQPISIYIKEKPFTNNNIQLKKGDCLYTFSDGYADQIGKGKKGKIKPIRLKDFLLTIYTKPMNEQKNMLADAFHNWKGLLEQVDDLIAVGVKI